MTYASNCMQNTNMLFFACDSVDVNTSSCYCALRGPLKKINRQTIKNDELYQDLYIQDVNQINLDENWIPFTAIRILDCLNREKNSTWICKTYDFIKEKTICTCLFDYSLNYFGRQTIGRVQTKNIFKNINDIAILPTKKNIIIHNSTPLPDVNSSFIRLNTFFLKKKNPDHTGSFIYPPFIEINQKNSTNADYIFIQLLIILIIICLLITIVFKKLRYKFTNKSRKICLKDQKYI